MIETETGFIKRDFEKTGVFLNIMFLIIMLLIGCFAFTSDRFPVRLPAGSKPLAVFSFLTAAGQLYEIAASHRYDEPVAIAIYSLLLLLCAVFFVLYGLSQLYPIKIPSAFTVIPVVTMAYKLIVVFMRYTGMANISDNLLETGMLISLTLFFLWLGKIFNGMLSNFNIRILFASGLLAVLFCFVGTLPRFFLIFAGMGNVLHIQTLPNPADVALGLFIVAFLLEYFSLKNLEPELPENNNPFPFPDINNDFYLGDE